MGNIPLFPFYNPPANAAASAVPELNQDFSQRTETRERRTYIGLDPLPQYIDDPEYFAKLAETDGRLLRSAMKPEVKLEPEPESQDIPEEEGLEILPVEAILKKRKQKKKLEYLVKWENCPQEASTWEPEERLKGFPHLIAEFERDWLAKRLESKRKNIPKPGPGRGWTSRKRAAKNAREAKRRKLEEQQQSM